MLVGYARVSTRDQNPHAHVEALNAAGFERVFTEQALGAQRDRLARSVRQLVETAARTTPTATLASLSLRPLLGRQGSRAA